MNLNTITHNSINKCAILIPAYNPDGELTNLIQKLVTLPEIRVVIVNDGSINNSSHIFAKAQELTAVVLHHAINLGKGASLKYGLNHIYTTFPEVNHIITADADGQHHIDDIKRMIQISISNSNELILGVRTFDHGTKKIPLRSQIGNTLTRKLTSFFTGLKISDTQTGLRSIPRSMITSLLLLKTTRYDFEFDMLLLAATKHIMIRELPIKTIYIDDNKSSHFNPLVDSMKIYFVLLRFIGSSLVTAGIDYLSFVLTMFFTHNLALSQCTARLIAGSFNYNFNKRTVFHKTNSEGQEEGYRDIIFYIFLVIVHGIMSYYIILLMTFGQLFPILVAKLLAEGILFLSSFFLQRFWVFRANPLKEEGASL